MNKLRPSLIKIAVLFLILGSCKLGPDYEDPNLNLPTYWNSADKSIQVDSVFIPNSWWTYFEDPILDTLIREALVNNRNVLIAAQRVERSMLLLNIQKAALWPSFSYNGSSGINSVFTDPNLSIGSSMAWELDFWGRLRRLNESQKALFLSDINAQRALQIELISQVANSYYQLLEFRQRTNIAIENTNLRDSMQIIIGKRFKGGVVPEIDLNQAQIQYAISASSVPSFKRLSAQTEQNLSVLVGRLPSTIANGNSLENQKYDLDLALAIPSEIVKNRPDIVEAEQELIAQNAEIGAAVANLYPRFSLNGSVSYGSNNIDGLDDLFWNLGLNLTGPLWQWRRNLRAIEVEKKDTEIALLAYEQKVLTAFAEVENALISIQTLRDEIVARKLHVEAANSAQDLSYKRYNQGVTSYLEYLESQRQAFDAQNFLAQTQAQLLTAYFSLYKATGGGWLNENEKAQSDKQ
jgi:outer membrane protein, multidrug efflux system